MSAPTRAQRWIVDAQRRALPANVREFMRFTEATGVTRQTLKALHEVLRRVTFEVGDLDTLGVDQLATWLGRPDWSNSTKATYGAHLRSYYRWAVDTDRLVADPMRKLPKPRVSKGLPKPVTEDQLQAILDVAPPWLRLAVLIASYAGLRCMELVDLQRADVTAEAIHIRCGKGGKEATVPCHRLIWEAVRGLPDGPVLRRNSDGGAFRDSHALSSTALRWFEANEFPGVHLHRFRHRFGTRAYRTTKDLLLTSRLLRHSSVGTTMGYTKLDDDAARGAVDLL